MKINLSQINTRLENLQKWIVIWEAVKQGKIIQWLNSHNKWVAIAPDIVEHYSIQDLRVTPEPRKYWKNQYPSGLSFDTYRDRDEAIKGRHRGWIGEPIEFVEVIS